MYLYEPSSLELELFELVLHTVLAWDGLEEVLIELVGLEKMPYLKETTHLFGERLLAARHEQHIVEQYHMHITSFAHVKVAQCSLVHYLPPWAYDQLFAGLLRENLLEELQQAECVWLALVVVAIVELTKGAQTRRTHLWNV